MRRIFRAAVLAGSLALVGGFGPGTSARADDFDHGGRYGRGYGYGPGSGFGYDRGYGPGYGPGHHSCDRHRSRDCSCRPTPPPCPPPPPRHCGPKYPPRPWPGYGDYRGFGLGGSSIGIYVESRTIRPYPTGIGLPPYRPW